MSDRAVGGEGGGLMMPATPVPGTLADLYASSTALLNDGLAPNSIASYRRAWRLRVAPTLGHLRLEEITPLAVMNAHAAWTGSPSTRQDGLALVSKLANLAVLGGVLTVNPVRSMPRKRRTADDDPAARALTDEQVVRMLDLTASHAHGQRLLAALVYTGCRLGEVVGLMRSDVEENVLRVRRSYSPDGTNGGRLRLGPTKGRTRRAVPILPALRPHLEAAIADAKHEHLFTGIHGGPVDSGNLARAVKWYEIRDELRTFPEGEPPLRFHDLRHTAAVNFFRAGLSAPDVRRILGHSSLAVTERYARSGDDAALRAVAAFQAS